jgi:hypothetical protein
MKELYVLSYGLHPGQMTLETLAAMRACGAVYSNSLDEASLRKFRRLVPEIKLTSGLGHRGTAREVAKGFARHDKVGFLTYGNPLFLNRSAAEVMAAAKARGAAVTVFPGVSSFDAIINLFNLNKYSTRGLRLVDLASASDLHFFTPEMDTLFFVPDVLNLPASAGRKRRFLAAAARAYPPSAPVYAADCVSISNEKTRVEKCRVGGLAGLFGRLNERHTIYIPAAAKKKS